LLLQGILDTIGVTDFTVEIDMDNLEAVEKDIAIEQN
jgi:hypothetical protein